MSRPTMSRRRFGLLLALTGATAVGVCGPAAAQESVADAAARLAELDAQTQVLQEKIRTAETQFRARTDRAREATGRAHRARVAADAAQARATAEKQDSDEYVRAAYTGNRTEGLSAVLVAGGPQELLDRMSGLDLVGEDRGERLDAANSALEQARLLARAAADEETAAARLQQDGFVELQALVDARAELARRSAEADALLEKLTAQALAASQARSAASRAQARVAAPAVLPPQLAVSQQAAGVRTARAAQTSAGLVVAPAFGRFTSGFGTRNGSPHNGIDIANTIGTPIVSVADGVVVEAGPASGFGLWVRVQLDDGTLTTYGHNNSNTVSSGQRVAAGQQIATIGNRGQSSGPHVHFEVEPPGAGKVNPQPWLAARGVSL